MQQKSLLGAAAAMLLASALAAQAALPPNFQRARELTAIVDAVAGELRDHPIDSVSHVDGYIYEVVAGPCRLTATIVPKPSDGMVGPLQFTVELSPPECTD